MTYGCGSCDVSLRQALGGQQALPPDSVANGSLLMLNAAEIWLSTIADPAGAILGAGTP